MWSLGQHCSISLENVEVNLPPSESAECSRFVRDDFDRLRGQEGGEQIQIQIKNMSWKGKWAKVCDRILLQEDKENRTSDGKYDDEDDKEARKMSIMDIQWQGEEIASVIFEPSNSQTVISYWFPFWFVWILSRKVSNSKEYVMGAGNWYRLNAHM